MTPLATQPSSRTSIAASRRRPHGSRSTTSTRPSAQVSVVRNRTGGSPEGRRYRLRSAVGTAAVVAAMAGGSSTSTAGIVGPAPYSAHSMVYSLSRAMAQFRRFFSGRGFRGPLWVTEHGYPGDTRFQRDPDYRGGEPAQARYLRRSIPTLIRAGAGQVFVTLRDSFATEFGDSKFASEGVLHVDDSAPYQTRRKPAYVLTQWLSSLWPTLPATDAPERRSPRRAADGL